MKRFKIPSGWKRPTLADVAEVRTGLAKGKNGLRDPVELPYLRVANVQDGHLDLSEVKTISVEKDQIDRYSLRPGDILMTEGGDFDKLGRGDVWRGQISPCLHQNHVFSVRPKADLLDPFFLAALAASPYGRAYFLGCAKRSTNLASINSSQLKAFPVLVPPIDEQRRIAKILATWDAGIAIIQRLLNNNRRHKQGLLEGLLSGPRCLGRTRDNWRSASLKDVADVIISSVDKKHAANEQNVRLCNYTDVYYNDYITSDLNFTRGTASGAEISKFAIRRGDVLLTKDSETAADIASSACVTDNMRGVVCGYHLAIIRPRSPLVDPEFLRCSLSLSRTRAYFSNNANGVTRFGLPLAAIRDAPILFPNIHEQRRIAAAVSTAAGEISARNRDLDSLRLQKRGVMQQLLTGKRRVSAGGPDSWATS